MTLRLPRFTLLSKILLALLVVGLVPLAVASLGLMGANRDAMAEQVLRTHAVAAKTTAERVEAFLTARREVARGAVANPSLQRDPRSAEGTAALRELLRSPLGIVAAAIRNSAGGEVVRAQAPGRGSEVDALLDSATPVRGSLLHLSVPIPGSDGFLHLICDLGPLAAHLQPRELGEQAEMVLVDKVGGTLLGRLGAASRSFPQSMLRAALSGKISGSGRFANDPGNSSNGTVLGAYAPVPGSDWTVLSRQPAGIAEATAVQLRRRGWIATGVAALLCLLAVVLAQRSVVQPIRELITAQRRLAGSDGEVPDAVEGGEIAQLKASFQLLEQRLRERQALDEVFLGRYQVVDVVGEGAMGTVFRGWDPALQRPVALKTVRFDSLERAEQAQSLLQEAVAVARFNHPNIVGIYDVQESPEVAFLSMEFIDGESLDHYLGRHPDLGLKEIVTLGLGIARGLAAAHSRGILHRDIKPANVLLSHEGEIKIADFGISQSMASLGDEDGVVFGTPGFIPPETLTGEGYSPAGDLFALGATLYRLLTGRLPFTGKTITEMIHNTVADPLLRPKALIDGVPEDLDVLIVELLDKERDRRPPADEVVLRLEALADGFGSSGTSWTPRPQNLEIDELTRQPTSLLTPNRPAHSCC